MLEADKQEYAKTISRILEERDHLQIILESIGDGIITTDMEGYISMMNPVAEKLTGWNREEALGKHLDEVFRIIDNTNKQPLENPFNNVFTRGLSQGLLRNSALLDRDGETRFASACASPIIDKNQKRAGMVVVFRDIDRIKKNEDEIRCLSWVLQLSSNAIIIFDTQGIIQFINSRFTQLTGYEACEVVNRNLSLINNLPLDVEKIFARLRVGEEWHDEVFFHNHQLEPCWWSIYCTAVRDEEDKITSYCSIIQDISEHKQAEENLKKAKEAAEVANRAKAEFLANMSHEIRTPLNAIIGMTSLSLLSNPEPDQKENLEIIKMAGDTLLSIIDNILDFSKIEAGKLTIEKIDFNLHELVEKNIAIHKARAQEKGLLLLYYIDPAIPVQVNGDPYRLQQVFNNLIGNAIKFTDQGEVEVRLKLLDMFDDHIVLQASVADTGRGITAGQQEKMFESFYQGDSSISRTYGGTGLGLNISKKIVEMMQGKIWLESDIESGSTFYFTVELGIPEPPKLEAESNQAINQKADSEKVPSLSILVVEDNEVNQMVLSNLLRSQGHQVEVAVNGVEALELLDKNNHDLVFMDILMPVMDGLETTRRIREQEEITGFHIPIIAITAHAIYGDREKFLAAGMDDYLAKPVQMEELNHAISKMIKKARSTTTTINHLDIEPLSPKDLFFKVDSCFLEQVEKAILKLDLALLSLDLQQVEKWAHEIKELAYQMDEITIKNLAFKIELGARKGDLDQCWSLFRKLQEIYAYLSSLGS